MTIIFLLSPNFRFQDPVTDAMEWIVDLHDYIMFYLVLICFFVLYMFAAILYFFHSLPYNTASIVSPYLRELILREKVSKISHGRILEVVWTLLPSIILIAIAFPSFALLYAADFQPGHTYPLRVVGHQWYWSYEFPEVSKNFPMEDLSLSYDIFDSEHVGMSMFPSESTLHKGISDLSLRSGGSRVDSVFNFSSYMLGDDDLNLGDFRLLEVDRPLVLPVGISFRVLVTSSDVLHSWAIPSCGLKIDAIPGRLNQVFLQLKRTGVFYGQCSELCGSGHAFMPIAIYSMNL